MDYMKRCYRKSPSVISKAIEDEVVIAVVQDNVGNLESIYTLDGVGAYIWKLIDGKMNLEAIKRIIIKDFEVKSEKLEDDLILLFKQLENERCIEISK